MKIHYSFIIIAALTMSGCASMYLKNGKESYTDKEYQDAIWYLEKGIAKKEDAEARKMLGDAYMLTGQFEQAIMVYNETGLLPSSDSDKMNHAMALMSQGRYGDAETILEGINSRDKSNEMAQSLLFSCRKLGEMTRDSMMYTVAPVNLSGVSTAYSPFVYNGGLMFTSALVTGDKDLYTERSFTDIYFSKESAGVWSAPEEVKGVNSAYHDAAAVISPNGQTMIFTRNLMLKGKQLGKNEGGESSTQLYMSKRNADNTWGKPEMLPFCDGKNMYAHSAFSPDGGTLYFSSDMASGYGGMDLYESKFTDGTWGTPKNLGTDVNTEGDDVFPTMHNADTLYFSSDAHQSLGGLDILYSLKKEGGMFGEPKHLSYPINSQRDDMGLVLTSGSTGYFSSDRTGSDKIYSFSIDKPEIIMNGLVTGKDSMLPLGGVKVVVKNITDGTEETYFTDGDGHYTAPLEPGKDYRIETELDNYFRESETMSTKGIESDKTYDKVTELREVYITPDDVKNPIVKDDTVKKDDAKKTDTPKDSKGIYKIDNIFWDYNKWNIREDSKPILQDLANTLKNNKELRVQMRSHSDCRGSDAFNDDLSNKRAKEVADYLVTLGVPRHMLTSKGFGKRELVNNCDCTIFCHEEQHEQNRRTEFVVTGKK